MIAAVFRKSACLCVFRAEPRRVAPRFGLGGTNREVGALYLTIHRAITVDAYARASSADNNELRSRGISTLLRSLSMRPSLLRSLSFRARCAGMNSKVNRHGARSGSTKKGCQ